MKRKENKTTTYEVGEALIDIVEAELYEAWIYKENAGEKMLMFSCVKDQQTLEEFVETVEANAEEYLDQYKRECEAWELFFNAAEILK